jgi:hypothetical protein
MCHSDTDTGGVYVPARQIKGFSTFSLSSELRQFFSWMRDCCKSRADTWTFVKKLCFL